MGMLLGQLHCIHYLYCYFFFSLICSDALARGIDIKNVDIVISYEPANQLTTYIHRIGRTARAGKSGSAITIITTEEYDNFMNLVNTITNSNITELNYNLELFEKTSEKYSNSLKGLQVALKVHFTILFFILYFNLLI